VRLRKVERASRARKDAPAQKARKAYVDVNSQPKPPKEERRMIVKGWVRGHKARILINTGSDLECISTRFVKRTGIHTKPKTNPYAIQRYTGTLIGNVTREASLLLWFGSTEEYAEKRGE
jgi:hypothetical protein